MKKSIVQISIFLIGIAIQAQNFTGKAYYASKTNMEGNFKMEGKNMDPAQMKAIEEQMKKAMEKNYILSFNKTESVFEEEQKLEQPATGGFQFKMASSNDDKLYKNLKTNQSISESEFFGKEFLIIDQLTKYDWKLTDETKKIGEYTCYKATAIIPVTNEEKKQYEEFKNKKTESKTVFFSMSEPKDKTITVWYSPDISVSHGPAEYNGLPGLILETNFEKTTMLCTKIVLNPKDKVEIAKLTKGKKVTKAEFEKIMQERMAQMSDGKGGMQIHITR